MRRVFTSPRLENVEGVANLLREHEIEVKITNGRTFRGSIRGNFSYRAPPDTSEQPAVWVVYSEDQPKARELLREAGLLESGRSPTSYLATPSVHELRGESGEDFGKKRAFRFRAALFVGIAAALGLTLMSWRKPGPSTSSTVAAEPIAATAQSPTTSATSIGQSNANDSRNDSAIMPPQVDPEVYPADTPTALAAMLVQAELAAQPATQLCLSVDTKPASQAQIDALALPATISVSGAADCRENAAKDRLGIVVGDYRTDGSGTGTIRIAIIDLDKDGKPRVDTRTLKVQRNDLQWKVLRVVAESDSAS
jgi:hypothetical protein